MTFQTERTIADAVSEINDQYRSGVIKSRMPKMTQPEFIAILFNDAGYNTASQRKGWLQLRYGKNFADELTAQEASNAIDQLKSEKAGHSGVREDDD